MSKPDKIKSEKRTSSYGYKIGLEYTLQKIGKKRISGRALME